MEKKAIGILTSGGDCGGLNAVVKSAAKMAITMGYRPYAILNGYAGLYNLIDHNNVLELTEELLETVDILRAGSRIGNSRVKISAISNATKYERIKQGLEKFKIHALVIAGGDDTGSVTVDLNKNGIACIHVPKTMDLDLQTYSVGGDSSINRSAEIIHSVKTSAMSHNRAMVVEVFGRYAGHVAMRAGLAAEADCILIPEIPVDFDVVFEHMRERMLKRLENSALGETHYTIVAAEGLRFDGELLSDGSMETDAFGHVKMAGIGKAIRKILAKKVKADDVIKEAYRKKGIFVEGMNEGPEVREVIPSYLTRSGEVSAWDACYGWDMGAAAMVLIDQGITGVTVTGFEQGHVAYVKTEKAIVQRFVDEELVKLYEKLGVCFGRRPVDTKIDSHEVKDPNWNYI